MILVTWNVKCNPRLPKLDKDNLGHHRYVPAINIDDMYNVK